MKRKKGNSCCRKKLVELFLATREAPQVYFCNEGVRVKYFFENVSPSFFWHQEEVAEERMNGCKKKNPLNFYWRQKKLDGFVFCKVELTWRKIIATKKDKEEEKVE